MHATVSLWFASDEFCCSDGGKGKEEVELASSGALLGDGVEGSGVERFMWRGNVSECSSWFLCGFVPLKDVFSLSTVMSGIFFSRFMCL